MAMLLVTSFGSKGEEQLSWSVGNFLKFIIAMDTIVLDGALEWILMVYMVNDLLMKCTER